MIRNLILLMLFVPFSIEAQGSYSKIGETEHFEFHSSYWVNMHHFLYQEALIRSVADSSIMDGAVLEGLTTEEKEKLESGVVYYKDNLLSKDLRSSNYMSRLREWMSTQNAQTLRSVPRLFDKHIELLHGLDEIYRNHFWPTHRKASQKVLSVKIDLIKKIEQNVVKELSLLTREYWDRKKIRVDMTYFAKSSRRNLRNRPYTSLFPTHIIMPSYEDSYKTNGSWIELLFHEASHSLIGSGSGFVGGTIQDVARAMDQKVPESLWHAYLFYFSGITVQKLIQNEGIKNYQLYMKRNRVFSLYHTPLEAYLPEYIAGTMTLAEASEKIIEAINK